MLTYLSLFFLLQKMLICTSFIGFVIKIFNGSQNNLIFIIFIVAMIYLSEGHLALPFVIPSLVLVVTRLV